MKGLFLFAIAHRNAAFGQKESKRKAEEKYLGLRVIVITRKIQCDPRKNYDR
jgi:hypothetical protein